MIHFVVWLFSFLSLSYLFREEVMEPTQFLILFPILLLPFCFQKKDFRVHLTLGLIYTAVIWMLYYGYQLNGIVFSTLIGCYLLFIKIENTIIYLMVPTLLLGVDYSGLLGGMFLVIAYSHHLKLKGFLFVQGISAVLSLPLLYIEFSNTTAVTLSNLPTSILCVVLFYMTVFSSVFTFQKHHPLTISLIWLILFNVFHIHVIPLLIIALAYFSIKPNDSLEYKPLKLDPTVISKYQLKWISIGVVCLFLNTLFFQYVTLHIIQLPQQSNASLLLTEQVRQMQRQKCFNKIQKEYISSLTSIIPKHSTAVLIDVPNHDNLGDSFIWLGEELALSRIGIQIKFQCYSHTSECKDNIPWLNITLTKDTVILLHGGGNQGDLYRFETLLRNLYVEKFKQNQIIFLPQSIYYQNIGTRDSDALLYKQHPNLHILARSKLAKSELDTYFKDTKGYLVPDSAFMIGPVEPICDPTLDLIFLKRKDKESASNSDHRQIIGDFMEMNGYTYKIVDWFDYEHEERQHGYFNGKPADRLRLPQWSLDVANRILCRGKVILTDRLHATILAMLMDKPVVALENNYGKIKATTQMLTDFGGQDCSEDVLRRNYKSYNNLTAAMQAVKNYLKEI